jgi:hypothetical protein
MNNALFAENFEFRKYLSSFFKYSIGVMLILSISNCSTFKQMTGDNDGYENDPGISDESSDPEEDELEITGDESEDIVMSEPSLPEEESAIDCGQIPPLSVPNVGDTAFYAEYSKKLGIRLDGTENKRLLMAAVQWMGAPYKWGGCLKSGVDCSCLVKLIYKEVYGISLNRTTLNIINKDIFPVIKAQLKEGDIVSFKRNEDSRISHIGIYLKNNKFIHVSRTKGVMISDLGKRYYRTWFFSAGRTIKKADKKPYIAGISGTKRRIRLSEMEVVTSASPQARQTVPATSLLAKASELSAKTAGMP